ncbi:MAG: AsmA family protein, partial [Bdellovibrionales bacterium]|nr:AsmA family protein [Bdellovibrionales bacterium]
MKLKKVFIILGGLLGLLMLAAVALPFFIDVDQYRPQLLRKANAYLNGRVELGRLKLSLWGQVKVDIAGLEVLDSSSRKILSVKDAHFILPFSSILSGAPQLTLRMSKPSISVLRESNGQINVISLLKKNSSADSKGSAAQPAAPGQDSKAKAEDAASEVEIPAIVARARLGFEVVEGSLRYVDEQKKIDTLIEKLNVRLPSASLLQSTVISVQAQLNTKVGESLSLVGPIGFSAVLSPLISAGVLKELGMTLEFDGSDLQISLPGIFEKKKGIPLSVSGKLAVSPERARIDSLNAKFHKSELLVSGSVEQISGGAQTGGEPQMQLKASTKSLDLSSFTEIVPLLEPYRLAGNASLDMELKGPATGVRYQGKLSFSSVSFSHPKFKVDPKIDGSIQIATNELQDIQVQVNGPGSDLKISGKLQDFLRPSISLSVTSTAVDLDQWLVLPDPKSTASSVVTAPATESKKDSASARDTLTGKSNVPSSKAVTTDDFDALLDPLRNNPIALATTLNAVVDVKKCKVRNVVISNIRTSSALRNLSIDLRDSSLEVFGGRVASPEIKLELKPEHPKYIFKGSVKGLQIQKAVESQFALFKNTLFGNLSAEVSGAGSSFNPNSAIDALSMNGSFEVRQARFATLDVAKMAFDGINQSIAKVAEKVPLLKGKQLGAMAERDSAYDLIRGDFQMKGGKFSASNFVAKAEPKKGIDLNGSLSVSVKDLALYGKFDVLDTYNLTKAEELSVDIAGVSVPRLLAEKGKPVR